MHHLSTSKYLTEQLELPDMSLVVAKPRNSSPHKNQVVFVCALFCPSSIVSCRDLQVRVRISGYICKHTYVNVCPNHRKGYCKCKVANMPSSHNTVCGNSSVLCQMFCDLLPMCNVSESVCSTVMFFCDLNLACFVGCWTSITTVTLCGHHGNKPGGTLDWSPRKQTRWCACVSHCRRLFKYKTVYSGSSLIWTVLYHEV